MKRLLVTVAATMLAYAAFSQVQLYLGVRGGGGEMLSRDKLRQLRTTDGAIDVLKSNTGWSAHAKGEALLGFRRLRIGYQFLYNFASPTVVTTSYTPTIDGERQTTYFNSRGDHFFGHYLLLELAIINARHFALTPGVAVGGFTGFKVDDKTGQIVRLADVTNKRFSIGGELNAEIKFGRCVILFGPNYYLFNMQDKVNSNWHEYQHFIGGDLGLRVNLLKNKGGGGATKTSK